MPTRPPENEPRVAAIARRVREFLFSQPGFDLPLFAAQLGVTKRDLRAVLAPERALVDPIALIDVIVEVVRRYGVDVNWILTGDYDPATHRKLDEEGGVDSLQVRRIVTERFSTWSASRPAGKRPD
jgi:hypothetical protein